MKNLVITILAILLAAALGYIAWNAYTHRRINLTLTPNAPITADVFYRSVPGTTLTIPVGDPADGKHASVTLARTSIGEEQALTGTYTEGDTSVYAFMPILATSTVGVPILDVSGEDGTFVVAPLYLNFGGTGTFLMLALFERTDTGTFVHRDTHFIDDRIPFDGFTPGKENTIEAHYRTRVEGEALADLPTHEAVRTLTRVGGHLVLVE